MARILIVDDARFIRQLLGNLLAKAGHDVVGEAENGLEAIRMYDRLRPDLLMIDITMPELDGIDAMKQVLEIDPAAKVVVCSAVNAKPKVIMALQAGARDFILKPIKAERVLEAVDRVLAQPSPSATTASRLRESLGRQMPSVPGGAAPAPAASPPPAAPAPAATPSPAASTPPSSPGPEDARPEGDGETARPEGDGEPARPKFLPWRMQQQQPKPAEDPAGEE